MDKMKKCTKCKKELPATNEYFAKGRGRLVARCKSCSKLWWQANRHIQKVKLKEYYKLNKDKILEQQRQNYESNKERILERQKQYYEENKEWINKQSAQKVKKRKKTDVKLRILESCRNRLYQAIKGKNKSASTKKLIGCSIKHLLQHLESQFQEGMTWDNYGEWHVDHIKPCALFDFTKEEDQRECFHYTNLQPLWAEDNLRKGSNYDEELMFESRRSE